MEPMFDCWRDKVDEDLALSIARTLDINPADLDGAVGMSPADRTKALNAFRDALTSPNCAGDKAGAVEVGWIYVERAGDR